MADFLRCFVLGYIIGSIQALLSRFLSFKLIMAISAAVILGCLWLISHGLNAGLSWADMGGTAPMVAGSILGGLTGGIITGWMVSE